MMIDCFDHMKLWILIENPFEMVTKTKDMVIVMKYVMRNDTRRCESCSTRKKCRLTPGTTSGSLNPKYGEIQNGIICS